MPPRDPRALLDDIIAACDLIVRCTSTLEQYRADDVARAAVERQFEIIGEAVKRLLESEPAISLQLPEAREIVDFRNFLAHGYHLIDHEVVWGIITSDVPRLRAKVAAIIEERSGTGWSK